MSFRGKHILAITAVISGAAGGVTGKVTEVLFARALSSPSVEISAQTGQQPRERESRSSQAKARSPKPTLPKGASKEKWFIAPVAEGYGRKFWRDPRGHVWTCRDERKILLAGTNGRDPYTNPFVPFILKCDYAKVLSLKVAPDVRPELFREPR